MHQLAMNSEIELARQIVAKMTDEELVDAFVRLTGDLSSYEAHEATGISSGTIQRLRRGDWKRLFPSTKRTMRDFMMEMAAERPGAFFLQELDPDEMEDVRLVREYLDERRDESPAAIASQIPLVTGSDIARLQLAYAKMRPSLPFRINWDAQANRAFAAVLHYLKSGTGEHPGAPEDSWEDEEAEHLFRHFEGIIRTMGDDDVDPEEIRLRKLDALEGLRRFYSHRGPVPSWWVQLKAKVDRGEI